MGSDVEKSLILMILFMLNFDVARCLQTNCWTKVIGPVSGRTCIHIATSKGCLSVAIALLTARADVNFPDPLEGKGTSFDGFPVCLCVDPKQFYLWALYKQFVGSYRSSWCCSLCPTSFSSQIAFAYCSGTWIQQHGWTIGAI